MQTRAQQKQEEIARLKGKRTYKRLGTVWLAACGIIAGGFGYTAYERELESSGITENRMISDALYEQFKEACKENKDMRQSIDSCINDKIQARREFHYAQALKNRKVGYSVALLFLLGTYGAGSAASRDSKKLEALEANRPTPPGAA